MFVVFGIGVLGLTSIWSYVWFAFVGVAVAMVAVYALGSAGRGGATPLRLTLAGVALGAVMDDVSATVRLVRPRAFDYLRFWDAGALTGRPMSIAAAVAPFIAVGLVFAIVVARSLNAVALGDDLARSLGTNVARTRALAIIAVMLLTGAATAAVGPIGFVGLMVPHVVRGTGAARAGDGRGRVRPGVPQGVQGFRLIIVALSAVMGAALLAASDFLAQRAFAPTRLPVGVVTVPLGGVYFVWLLAGRPQPVGQQPVRVD
ncbi:FecCD family ABC transporter permease [Luedemannella flava]|uniref:FecCD family ABC transporter permease n=1 Tax=Luedemannella flava TaxID=349316 RepID=UPI0031DDC906